MNVCRTFPEWVLDLDPLLRLSRYHDGCSQYLEEHLVSWRGRAHFVPNRNSPLDTRGGPQE